MKGISTIFTYILALIFFIPGANATVTTEMDAQQKEMRINWGIEVTSVRLAVDGNMVDFRYRVLIPEKAKPLFNRKNKPYLIDEASQKVLTVPNLGKVGPLRTSNNLQAGRIYWMFFGNTHKLVKAGSKVSVVIGDFRVDDLIVQ